MNFNVRRSVTPRSTSSRSLQRARTRTCSIRWTSASGGSGPYPRGSSTGTSAASTPSPASPSWSWRGRDGRTQSCEAPSRSRRRTRRPGQQVDDCVARDRGPTALGDLIPDRSHRRRLHVARLRESARPEVPDDGRSRVLGRRRGPRGRSWSTRALDYGGRDREPAETVAANLVFAPRSHCGRERATSVRMIAAHQRAPARRDLRSP